MRVFGLYFTRPGTSRVHVISSPVTSQSKRRHCRIDVTVGDSKEVERWAYLRRVLAGRCLVKRHQDAHYIRQVRQVWGRFAAQAAHGFKWT